MGEKETGIKKMIVNNLGCVKCGAPYGKCDCWVKCSCGWLYEKGGKCNNPKHSKNKLK